MILLTSVWKNYHKPANLRWKNKLKSKRERTNNLLQTVKALKKEFEEFSTKESEEFIFAFEIFCKDKGLTKLEIDRLKQRHLARLNPEKIERIFNNWEDIIVFILQSGFISLLTLDYAKNNDFLSKSGKENFEFRLRENLSKDVESTLKSMFYTFLFSFISRNINENNVSEEVYAFSILTSIIFFVLLNNQVIDRISAIKQTNNQKNKVFEDLAGVIKKIDTLS